ncbi:MAG: hypothetical protein R3A46_16645 [Thermomicrobiales bacterium]
MSEEEKKNESLREHLEDDDHQDLRERMDEIEGNVRRPPRNDPRHTDDSVTPGGRDVPAGGSTGESMGGSAKKRKGHTG